MDPTRSDDPRAEDGPLYVFFGLVSLFLLALAVAALVLPPAFAMAYWLKGRHGVAAGFAAFWVLYMAFAWHRLIRRRPPPSA